MKTSPPFVTIVPGSPRDGTAMVMQIPIRRPCHGRRSAEGLSTALSDITATKGD